MLRRDLHPPHAYGAARNYPCTHVRFCAQVCPDGRRTIGPATEARARRPDRRTVRHSHGDPAPTVPVPWHTSSRGSSAPFGERPGRRPIGRRRLGRLMTTSRAHRAARPALMVETEGDARESCELRNAAFIANHRETALAGRADLRPCWPRWTPKAEAAGQPRCAGLNRGAGSTASATSRRGIPSRRRGADGLNDLTSARRGRPVPVRRPARLGVRPRPAKSA